MLGPRALLDEYRRQQRYNAASLPRIIPADVLVDEEISARYDWQTFCHPHPGDVFNHRYKLVAKVGWGLTSTVWLARDKGGRLWFRPKKYCAIKISTNNRTEQTAVNEVKMFNTIAVACSRGRGQPARKRFVEALDTFFIDGPYGPHRCLVLEPMRGPLLTLKMRLAAPRSGELHPSNVPLVKGYVRGILEGLEFLHTSCGIVHTGEPARPRLRCSAGRTSMFLTLVADLKLDNILMSAEHESLIARFADSQSTHPMARKVFRDHTLYVAHMSYGDIDARFVASMVPKIADFGLAKRGDGDDPLLHPIQPNLFRAPEVLLGTGWSYSADVWNFGTMLWELFGDSELFSVWVEGEDRRAARYSTAMHLAQMTEHLGPAPRQMTDPDVTMLTRRWQPAIRDGEGRVCHTVRDYFGGPYYDADGEHLSFLLSGVKLRARGHGAHEPMPEGRDTALPGGGEERVRVVYAEHTALAAAAAGDGAAAAEAHVA
ncbi:Serine/threonine-protein kinase SRPK [Tolypocladium ophioglossoides CBS 100239]|uniref:non-specific serine/threonine protein kinase n=1 Tax=Tolypocladium ophioglossoides (strain CBS 100239) TaxID=1163406 RepID=A0A0L0NN22_TOLOC|nr:Serine/threonine-protein kinase SRPK [Tolypocladium ophioglossoides CBS 100239]